MLTRFIESSDVELDSLLIELLKESSHTLDPRVENKI
jgi:hypothetical protein